MSTSAITTPPAGTRATGIVFRDHLDGEIHIPPGITSLEDFRCWVRSDAFPQRGRIDYVDGQIEVDMAAEAIYSHGVPKGQIAGTLQFRTNEDRLGLLLVDSSRISSSIANLSAEPDILIVARESLRSGRVRLIPTASKKDFIEIEGPADMLAEIVSQGSVTKDTIRLPELYYQAGVVEFWLIDARKKDLEFTIHRRGESAFEPVNRDEEGFQRSQVFGRRYRLTRWLDEDEIWEYRLEERALSGEPSR